MIYDPSGKIQRKLNDRKYCPECQFEHIPCEYFAVGECELCGLHDIVAVLGFDTWSACFICQTRWNSGHIFFPPFVHEADDMFHRETRNYSIIEPATCYERIKNLRLTSPDLPPAYIAAFIDVVRHDKPFSSMYRCRLGRHIGIVSQDLLTQEQADKLRDVYSPLMRGCVSLLIDLDIDLTSILHQWCSIHDIDANVVSSKVMHHDFIHGFICGCVSDVEGADSCK